MTEKDNTLAIENFAMYKIRFDIILKNLSTLSKNNFNINEDKINHSHCGDLLYHVDSLDRITYNIIKKSNKDNQS